MTFYLSEKSLKKLSFVHPDLAAVVKRAINITAIDFSVVEGLRSLEQQKKYVAEGKSTTMNSRHLTGHAVDLLAWVDNKSSDEKDHLHNIAGAMKEAAAQLEIPLQWGGDWQSFKDYPHYQLPWSSYPIKH